MSLPNGLPGVVWIIAEDMPTLLWEIDQRLEDQLLSSPYISRHWSCLPTLRTGIAFVLNRRMDRQGRYVFKRMLAWWSVTGDDPAWVASAVTILWRGQQCV
jgi:hypothetical protein